MSAFVDRRWGAESAFAFGCLSLEKGNPVKHAPQAYLILVRFAYQRVPLDSLFQEADDLD